MRFVASLLALVSTAPAQGMADPPPAACSQPHVLEAVEARLSRAGQPVVIERGSVGQVPGDRPGNRPGNGPGIVFCAVRVHRAVYDTPRFQQAPVPVIEVYEYALELRRNGIFLLP